MLAAVEGGEAVGERQSGVGQFPLQGGKMLRVLGARPVRPVQPRVLFDAADGRAEQSGAQWYAPAPPPGC
ncbi:hypothetical protein AB0D45_03770 [Streptomyces sp. NPDC048352]|uniref:hypothetical protein n=1 Tax=Streptomyces sp. NPDC048352 TaxID=3154718 RepID=UPI003441E7A4